MTHLLLTNDYPPKVGGIQSYLWELWRRLPPDSFHVLTSPHVDAEAFDAAQAHRIHRYDRFWLPPTRRVLRRARAIAAGAGAASVVVDPAFPLGAIAPELGLPYAVVLHGAEASVPARLPGASAMLRRALGGASLVISASKYAEESVRSLVPQFPETVYVPPGVDIERFSPLDPAERRAARRRLGFDPDAPLVVGVSRLVPRKGFDVLIEAVARLEQRHPGLQLIIAGTGRDERRLRQRIGSTGAPARLLGFVDDADLPLLYGCADASAMLCRTRWGGLEQEGFGIVFVEAAAAGCPQVAGRSGGSAEAVADGETGFVIDDPTDADGVARAIDRLLGESELNEAMRTAARRHAEQHFSYDLLAQRLRDAIGHIGLPVRPAPVT